MPIGAAEVGAGTGRGVCHLQSESLAAVAVTGFGAEREALGRPVMENRHDPLRDAAGPEWPSLD
jgi:hypothetical protein